MYAYASTSTLSIHSVFGHLSRMLHLRCRTTIVYDVLHLAVGRCLPSILIAVDGSDEEPVLSHNSLALSCPVPLL